MTPTATRVEVTSSVPLRAFQAEVEDAIRAGGFEPYEGEMTIERRGGVETVAATIALSVTVQISSVAAITLAKAVAKRIHKIRPKTNGVVKVLYKPDGKTLAEVRVEEPD